MSAHPATDQHIPSHVSNPNQILAGYVREHDFAKELGVDVRTVRRWHASRTGPVRTLIGRFPFYSRAAIDAWLEARTQKPCRRSRRS